MKGHKGNVYSIKMTSDGSCAFSVGSDKLINIWDVRMKSLVDSIDGSEFKEMNDIAFAPSLSN